MQAVGKQAGPHMYRAELMLCVSTPKTQEARTRKHALFLSPFVCLRGARRTRLPSRVFDSLWDGRRVR